MKHRLIAFATVFALTGHGASFAQERSIIVASTTSTEQSRLFGFLLPRFSNKTAIQVKVVAVGTGQALDIGRRGDADVVFVHDRPVVPAIHVFFAKVQQERRGCPRQATTSAGMTVES
jgi:tungstate transport system substrate-binding protein